MSVQTIRETLCGDIQTAAFNLVYDKVLGDLLAVVQTPPESVDAKLDTLIKKHYKTAENFLKLSKGASAVRDQTEYLMKARDEFIVASGVEPPDTRPFAIFYSAVCLDMLGDASNALDKYLETIEAGRAFLNEASAKNEKIAKIAESTGKEIASVVAQVGVYGGFLLSLPAAFLSAFSVGTAAVSAVGVAAGVATGAVVFLRWEQRLQQELVGLAS
ncbi:MAG: hypothetical protein ACKVY0_15055 [Prosthecobacter sp.]|uniref:hypothetical protein n=1 Tax=Prosthecobacter sp. TaxID=1965333 RepID=UPI003902E253